MLDSGLNRQQLRDAHRNPAGGTCLAYFCTWNSASHGYGPGCRYYDLRCNLGIAHTNKRAFSTPIDSATWPPRSGNGVHLIFVRRAPALQGSPAHTVDGTLLQGLPIPACEKPRRPAFRLGALRSAVISGDCQDMFVDPLEPAIVRRGRHPCAFQLQTIRCHVLAGAAAFAAIYALVICHSTTSPVLTAKCCA